MDTLLSVILDLADIRLFGIKLINTSDFWQLFARFSFNLIVILIMVRGIYFPYSRRKDYMFTYILFSAIVFLLCHLLLAAGDKLKLGLALGLFAIFGIIRYRTTTIPIKEMTYLFLITGIAVINALATKKISYAELLFANMIIVGTTFAVERILWNKREVSKTVTYEKIELIKPENHQELIKDLTQRTGLNINRVQIGRINLLRDTAQVRIFYFEEPDKAVSFSSSELPEDDQDDGLN